MAVYFPKAHKKAFDDDDLLRPVALQGYAMVEYATKREAEDMTVFFP